MPTISLATYVVRVNRKRKPEKEKLGEIDGHDLLILLEKFLKGRSILKKDADQKHVLQVRKYSIQGREITGQIETGEYGYGATLFDTTNAKVSYTRSVFDAEMLPFFFLGHFPKDKKTGVLIFQRFKSFGIRKLFAQDFGKSFEEACPEFSLKIEAIVPPKLVAALSGNGKVSRLRFREFKIPKDVCDVFDRQITPEDGYREYSIIIKDKLTLSDIKAHLKGSGKTTLLSIPLPKNFHPKSALIDVEINGKKRTINIQNLTKFRAYFDISPDVRLGNDGHPEFESVAQISRDLLNDIWTSILE
jgi:hypothetical protein